VEHLKEGNAHEALPELLAQVETQNLPTAFGSQRKKLTDKLLNELDIYFAVSSGFIQDVSIKALEIDSQEELAAFQLCM
jgi:hypothetical protein